MVSQQNINLIVKRLGCHRYSTIPPQNHMGGIWLLWNEENVDANVITKETRRIHCMVFNKINLKQCMLSVIYAPSPEQEKEEFWYHLKQLNAVIKIPWCIIGDFNEMLQTTKKIEGTQLNDSKVHRLNEFLAYTKGCDANVQGRLFTWKKLLRGTLVYEKLDKVYLGRLPSVIS